MAKQIADITGLDNVTRRKFLQRAGIGGGVALAGGAASYGAARVSLEG